MINKVLIQSILLLMSLFSISSVQAEVDWSPFLQLLKNSCQSYNIDLENIPKKYHASIISNKKITDKKNKIATAYGVPDIRTITLKNATAFGSPIKKIVMEEYSGGDVGSMTRFSVYFDNNNFIRNLSQFQAKEGKLVAKATDKKQLKAKDTEGEDIIIQTTGMGYRIETFGRVTELKVDKKTKQLSCVHGSF